MLSSLRTPDIVADAVGFVSTITCTAAPSHRVTIRNGFLRYITSSSFNVWAHGVRRPTGTYGVNASEIGLALIQRKCGDIRHPANSFEIGFLHRLTVAVVKMC